MRPLWRTPRPVSAGRFCAVFVGGILLLTIALRAAELSTLTPQATALSPTARSAHLWTGQWSGLSGELPKPTAPPQPTLQRLPPSLPNTVDATGAASHNAVAPRTKVHHTTAKTAAPSDPIPAVTVSPTHYELERLPPVPPSQECRPITTPPTNTNNPLLDPVDRHVRAAGSMDLPFAVAPLPPNFVPWWHAEVLRPHQPHARPRALVLDDVLVEALEYSPHVQAVRDTAEMRLTAITEAEAEFDVTAFTESKFVRLSDPVGNILTTGGPPRFRDQDWTFNTGVRKKTTYGGSLEAAQQLEFQDNNSEFLVPKSQGKARLTLSFTQPLLNGAGKAYNQSHIVLAQFDTRIATDEVRQQLADHLVKVTEAYWDLYLRRASLAQQRRHVQRAQRILKRLEDRRAIDALQSQVLTARAAVAEREANLNRAAAAVRNAEARLRMLVNAPEMFAGGPLEFIPSSTPAMAPVKVSLRDAMVTAMEHRPELDQAMMDMKKSAIRMQMTTKELLPVLNAVFETYVAGLEGESRIDQAWADQFQVGEPGYTAGLMFEIPIHNRAARARNQRQRIALRRSTNRLQATVQTLLTEVEIAVRELETSRREIASWYRSMAAARADVKYLQDRWELLPGDDRSASFLLEDLLRAQDRLAGAEFGFVKAQYSYALSLVQLKKAMGTLFQCDGEPNRTGRKEGKR